MLLPWECEDCSHSLQDSPFVSYESCPKCNSEYFYHGSMIQEDIEDYNIYDDEDESVPN